MKNHLLSAVAVVALACPAADAAAAQSGRRPKPAPTPESGGEAKGGEKAGGAVDDSKSYTSKEVTERAVITYRPEPAYPREARRYRVEGRVVLRIILGKDGKVAHEMEIIESLPYGLTDECIKAARKIEFRPARKGDRPVSQYAVVEYYFKVH